MVTVHATGIGRKHGVLLFLILVPRFLTRECKCGARILTKFKLKQHNATIEAKNLMQIIWIKRVLVVNPFKTTFNNR